MYKFLIYILLLSNVNVYAENFYEKETELMSCRKTKNQAIGYNTIFIDESDRISPILEPVLSINTIKSLEKNNENGCVTRSYSGVAFEISSYIADNQPLANNSVLTNENLKWKKKNKKKEEEFTLYQKTYENLTKNNKNLKNNKNFTMKVNEELNENLTNKLKTIGELEADIEALEDLIGYDADYNVYNVIDLQDKSNRVSNLVIRNQNKIKTYKLSIIRKKKEIKIKSSEDLVEATLGASGIDYDKTKDDFNILSTLKEFVRVNRNDIRTDMESDNTDMNFDKMANNFIEINEKKED